MRRNPWSYWLVAALFLALALGGLGCASSSAQSTVTVPMLDTTGKPIKDESGQPLTVTKTLTDEVAWYETQKAMYDQPMVSIKLPKDNDTGLPGGTEIAFRLPPNIQGYEGQFVRGAREVKSLAQWAFGIFALDRMADVAKTASSVPRTTTNTVNSSGTASPVSVTGGNSGALTGTANPATTTTTTTTDSHAGQ